MAIKKQKPHSSARKKAAAKASKPARNSKLAKTKADELAREKRLKKLEKLTLKIFRWAYESNQRGEFQRL